MRYAAATIAHRQGDLYCSSSCCHRPVTPVTFIRPPPTYIAYIDRERHTPNRGALDPEERKNLAEAGEEGDEEAIEELRAEHLDAIEAMIEALHDPESRKLIELGLMLSGVALNESEAGAPDILLHLDSNAPTRPDGAVDLFSKLFTLTETPNLDTVVERLESVNEQIEQTSTYGGAR